MQLQEALLADILLLSVQNSPISLSHVHFYVVEMVEEVGLKRKAL